MLPLRSCLLLLAAVNATAVLAADDLIAMSAEQAGMAGIATAALAEMKATGGIRLAAQVVVPPSQIEVIAAPLPAMVAAVRVAHGEIVKKDQVLVRLQGAPLLELQREFAQARSQAMFVPILVIAAVVSAGTTAVEGSLRYGYPSFVPAERPQTEPTPANSQFTYVDCVFMAAVFVLFMPPDQP